MRFSIKNKLIIGFGSLLLLFVVLSAVVIINMSDIENQFVYLAEHDAIELAKANELLKVLLFSATVLALLISILTIQSIVRSVSKKVLEALRDSEAEFATAFDASPNPMTITSAKDGCIVDVNAAFTHLLGYKPEELLGRRSSKLELWITPFDREKYLNDSDENSRFNTHEVQVRTKSGQIRWIQLGIEAIDIGGEQHFITVGNDITERKLIEDKLIEYQRHLKALTWKLSITEEQERKRIATWIHDEITQALIAVNMRLSVLQNGIKEGSVTVDIDGFKRFISELIEKTRAQAFDLSSPVLYMFGLEEAIRGYLTDEVGSVHKISTEFEDDGCQKPLDEDVKVQLYRSVRELLANTIKHAHAKNIKISMYRDGGNIKVTVEDDGIGFDTGERTADSDLTKGFGLFSIHENLNQVGGDVEIKSVARAGYHSYFDCTAEE